MLSVTYRPIGRKHLSAFYSRATFQAQPALLCCAPDDCTQVIHWVNGLPGRTKAARSCLHPGSCLSASLVAPPALNQKPVLGFVIHIGKLPCSACTTVARCPNTHRHFWSLLNGINCFAVSHSHAWPIVGSLRARSCRSAAWLRSRKVLILLCYTRVLNLCLKNCGFVTPNIKRSCAILVHNKYWRAIFTFLINKH